MTELKFGKTNVYAMVLQFVDTPAEYELRGVLDPLEAAIRAAGKRVERYAEMEEYEGQLMIDDECGYVEDLLGAVLVMGQRYLTETTSRILRLDDHVQRDTGASWSLPTRRYPLLAGYGPVAPGDASVRLGVGVNAGANFFKHSSEWSRPWVDLEGQPKRTFEVVERLGVEQSSTGNLRSIAEGLGITDYDDVRPLTNGLDAWRDDLLRAVRVELGSLGLL